MNRKSFGILQMCVIVMVMALIAGCNEKIESEKSEETVVSKQKESEGTLVSEQKKQTKKVILETNMGNIVIELDEDAAPVTVKNFIQYAEEGFYDNTVFHRVISNFMIQGGGFDPSLVNKQPRPPIVNEFKISNLRGTIAMAKSPNNPNSATSQFFINLNNNSGNLDNQNGGFTAFGKVVEGMDVVDKIAAVKTTTKMATVNGKKNPMPDVPAESVVIKSAKVVTQ